MYSSHQARETHIQKRACPSASAAVLSPTPWFYLYLITLHDLIIYSMILSPTPWFDLYLITHSMILSSTPWSYHLLHDFIITWSLTPWFYHLLHDFIITWSLTPWFYHLLHFITYSDSKFKCRRKGVLLVHIFALGITVWLSNLHSHRGRKWWGRGYGKGRHALSFCFFISTACPHRYTTG